ncbi:LysR family transcriptional regulator [Aminobacter aminovorans]|uniref:DNA-binding transcriptional LysR family regulator n=1 Tax=Aminobacter aminovorans TaxID=83263 RepID=A0AAC8YRE8_AMIAI|nr:LysR family transcriptional regulator [Aminobacter aminovorans]AMS42881.1 Putative Transcriptional regulator, LysR family [Aminobacter aminovorans]MBB3704730.1 DNA-binding transcriptional LysR family regulator [Aminobacter aminovorans]
MTGHATVELKTRAERFAAAVTLRQIRYFIAVAETGKVSAAAEMSYVSPSVITESIARLEGLAEAKLFSRHPRGLELTYEGRQFLSHTRNVLSAVEGAGAAVLGSSRQIEGVVRLAATITVMGYFLAPLLARFQRLFPNVEVRVMEANRPAIEDGLLSETYDAAIMLSSNLSKRSEFLAHTLVNSMRRLWLPSRHALLQNDIVTLQDIATLPYIQLVIDDAEASTASYWRRHQMTPNIIIRTESVEAIRSLIANGQGVTILSDMMYRPWSLEGDRIEVREVAADIPVMTVGAVWRRGRDLNAATQAFLNFCRTDSELLRTQSHRAMPPPSA